MTTDIVVTTCDRLPLLSRTLAYIWERTTTPYRLHVIDDASTDATADYVGDLRYVGKLASVLLRYERMGISASLRVIGGMTTSDPVVFTDDDILCPRLEPDWLARGLEAMEQSPKLGLLALNSPQCNLDGKRGQTTPGDPVTLCRNVPGSFVFVRRAVLAGCRPPAGSRSPVKAMCKRATKQGWQVGYLTHVYCQHIGGVSVRTGKDWRGQLERVLPVDDDTLEPPDEYKK
jgi:hypothetical protein